MWCSFCGKSQDQVDKLIAGAGVFICNECVGLCVDILGAEAGKPAGEPKKDPLSFWRALDDDGLLEQMPKIERVRTQVDDHLRALVDEARQRGLSWDRVGAALGMRRQSAWERFSSR